MAEEKKAKGFGKIKVWYLLVALLLILGGYVVSARNGLVRQQQEAGKAFSDIDVVLQRRNDLIPNLVSTVKGYAKHEEAVFNAVSEARERMLSAKSPAETVSADGELSQALGRLLAVAESYPELKANENFASLQDELAGTENRIAVARKDANEKIIGFNTSIKIFPKNLVAKLFGFDEMPLFEADQAAKTVPSVSFD